MKFSRAVLLKRMFLITISRPLQILARPTSHKQNNKVISKNRARFVQKGL